MPPLLFVRLGAALNLAVMRAVGAFLDQYDVAEILLISTRRVQSLVERNALPHILLPTGEIRFDIDDIHKWIEAHKQPAVAGVAE